MVDGIEMTTDSPKREAFRIESRVTLYLDYDLAVDLGNILREHCQNNPAIYALAMQLRNLAPPEERE